MTTPANASVVRAPEASDLSGVPGQDLRRLAIRGGAVTFSAQACKLLLQTAATIILARMLTPNDYGLVAMVTALTGFIGLFKDLGLTTATVQRRHITHRQLSTIFWINVAASVIIAVVTAALAPAIASFYQEPRLVPIVLALAMCFLPGGLSGQHHALLKRQMRFAELAMVDIGSMTVGVVVAVMLAFGGAGYWALVGHTAGTAISHMVWAWWLSGWLPGRPALDAELRGVLAFGGSLTGFNLLNYLVMQLDHVLIGRYWGAASLGLYSKAYGMLWQPIQQLDRPLSAVVVPSLSRLQDDAARFARYQRKALYLNSLVLWPLFVLLVCFSEQVVYLMLGSQWLHVAPLFRVFAATAFVVPLVKSAGWLFVTTGRSDRMLKLEMISASAMCAAYIVALPFGIYAVALAYTAVTVLKTVPSLSIAMRDTQLSFLEAWKSIKHPLTAAAVCGIGCFASRLLMPTGPESIITFVVGGSVGVAFYAVTLYFVGDLPFIMSVMRDLKPGASKA